ncbi:MAG TPA: glycosyltransferase [Bacteroidia bacterium]|jgi:glycosyltransferase involved in cell wall biosynthesis|nr:glycosyltransferase [Bacteroidia bacterium]
MKKAIVSVINDLVTDQRVNRTCLTLVESGYEVTLVGRVLKNSLSIPARPYSTHRMKLLFTKGVPFYIEFQIHLFFYLLFHKANLYFANDLDTLLPNYMVSKLKGAALIYDSHEYFTGVPELMETPVKRKIWKSLEKLLIPRLKHMFTVNDSIAKLYKDEFGTDVKVMRNLPMKKVLPAKSTRESLGLPADKNILLLQGAGININRGVEEAIQAMLHLDNCLLVIIGGGDAVNSLKNMTEELKLTEKVKFIAKLPFEELMQYTILADIGLTLDKDTNINYRYSLPNKLFDYIQAELPVLASPLIEIKRIIDDYDVGICIESHNPEEIAAKINYMLANKAYLGIWRNNAAKAREVLNWENEKKVLVEVLESIG